MKKRRITIYIILSIIILMTIGYSYLNTDLSMENSVKLNSLKRYNVTFDTNGGAINRFEGKELIFYDNTSIISHTLNNNIYTISTNYAYPSIMIPTELFEDGKTYTLKYKVKKINGTLRALGGHCPSTTKISLKLDGNEISSSYNQINMSDDNLTHEIEYKFIFNNIDDKRIYIQPNRGYETAIEYELWDIQVIEENYVETKTVTFGKNYGNLPVPVRDGYTFKGWNGKNLFNEQEILMSVDGATYADGQYIFNSASAQQIYGGGLPIAVSSNKTYTFSLSGYVEDGSFYIGFKYTNQELERITLYSTTEKVETTTSTSPVELVYTSFGVRGVTHISYIQLEEGDTATEYEPYYVQSNTKVTQDKNHTLTAIWEAN